MELELLEELVCSSLDIHRDSQMGSMALALVLLVGNNLDIDLGNLLGNVVLVLEPVLVDSSLDIVLGSLLLKQLRYN